jgi:hypothetical protein
VKVPIDSSRRTGPEIAVQAAVSSKARDGERADRVRRARAYSYFALRTGLVYRSTSAPKSWSALA